MSFDPEQPAAPKPNAVEPQPAATDVDPAALPTGRSRPQRCRVTARWSPARSLRVRSTRATTTVAPGRSPGRASSAIRELQVLARELVSSLQFYQGQPGALPFAEVLVAGGTSRLPGFVGELERITRVRVRAGGSAHAGRRSRTASATATTSRRSRSRSDWGWRTDACRQPPSERERADRRPRRRQRRSGGALTTTRVAIVGGAVAVVVCGIVGFTLRRRSRSDVAKKRDALARPAAGRRGPGEVRLAGARPAGAGRDHCDARPTSRPSSTRSTSSPSAAHPVGSPAERRLACAPRRARGSRA